MLDFGGGFADGPEYVECDHEFDVYYAPIDGYYHCGECYFCDFEVIEEHCWEDYGDEYYCNKCGVAQSDYE